MKKLAFVFYLTLISYQAYGVRLVRFGFINYSKSSFTQKESLNKYFVKLDIPIPVLGDQEKWGNLYLLSGGQYNFKNKNSLIDDNYLYLGSALNYNLNREKDLRLFLVYYFHSNYNLDPFAHDIYLGLSTDITIFSKLKLEHSLIWIRYIANHFLAPSPAFQFKSDFSDKWQLKFSILLDFTLGFYFPLLPTKAEVFYKTEHRRLGFGFNFEESIQSKPAKEKALWQEGARGLVFGQIDFKIYKDLWTGLQAGSGLELLKYFDKDGNKKKNLYAPIRWIPFFMYLNLNYKI